ncbi:MAG: hypothetical protein KAI22_04585 [Gammaproteobacteria bacterium]|nr:hypothetical protein [Gammaproteobacteria bacterium]
MICPDGILSEIGLIALPEERRTTIRSHVAKNTKLTLDDLSRAVSKLQCISFVTVITGQDCLDSVAQRVPDLILLGESMPLADDHEMKKMLRTNTRYKEMKNRRSVLNGVSMIP